MKLKVGQTVRIGFAFLSICAFWQLYNTVVPLMLTNTFELNKTVTGGLMALDNVLALFLLPIFGTLSDRTKARMGKRKPFILAGTVAAVILMTALPLLDNSFYAAPAGSKIAAFIVVLCLLLIAMGSYRSPAVALMPDLTPKPFRSRANAIINLMGAVGGILYLLLSTLLYSSKRTKGLAHVDYLPIFLIVALIMIIALFIVMFTINEPAGEKEVIQYEKEHPEENLVETDDSGKTVLPAPVKKSLGFLLASIALWYMSYNAVQTWWTTYANHEWGMSLGAANMCLTVATGGALLAYIPIGHLSAHLGRKRMILGGVAVMTIGFVIAFAYTMSGAGFSPALYVLFLAIGISWASISVNSLPMVLEMCKGSDIGKFTGYYYTFSMAAQIVTPIAAGWLLEHVGYAALFVYAAIFMAAAFVTMQFVRHGDNRVGKEA